MLSTEYQQMSGQKNKWDSDTHNFWLSYPDSCVANSNFLVPPLIFSDIYMLKEEKQTNRTHLVKLFVLNFFFILLLVFIDRLQNVTRRLSMPSRNWSLSNQRSSSSPRSLISLSIPSLQFFLGLSSACWVPIKNFLLVSCQIFFVRGHIILAVVFFCRQRLSYLYQWFLEFCCCCIFLQYASRYPFLSLRGYVRFCPLAAILRLYRRRWYL